jgi:hypothetical protein
MEEGTGHGQQLHLIGNSLCTFVAFYLGFNKDDRYGKMAI